MNLVLRVNVLGNFKFAIIRWPCVKILAHIGGKCV